MEDQKRGDDAADDAPRPGAEPPKPANGKQDAPNYADRENGGRDVPVEDMSSANDE